MTDFRPLKTGDILFVGGTGLISKIIRWGQGKNSDISHVAPIINPQGDIVEANPKGVERTNLWKRYYDAEHSMAIYRPFKMTDDQRDIFVAKCLERIGTPYGYVALLQHLIDNKIFGGRRVTRRWDIPGVEICSEEAVKVYGALGWTFGGNDQPQSMYDWCLAHPDIYAPVYKFGEI
jgi:hypothetical protein